MDDLVARQTCFGVQNRVRTLLHSWTDAERRERQQQRHVTTDADLERALVQELYLLETTQLPLWTRPQLERLARRLGIPPDKDSSNVVLAERLALIMVRDQQPYQVRHRKLVWPTAASKASPPRRTVHT